MGWADATLRHGNGLWGLVSQWMGYRPSRLAGAGAGSGGHQASQAMIATPLSAKRERNTTGGAKNASQQAPLVPWRAASVPSHLLVLLERERRADFRLALVSLACSLGRSRALCEHREREATSESSKTVTAHWGELPTRAEKAGRRVG